MTGLVLSSLGVIAIGLLFYNSLSSHMSFTPIPYLPQTPLVLTAGGFCFTSLLVIVFAISLSCIKQKNPLNQEYKQKLESIAGEYSLNKAPYNQVWVVQFDSGRLNLIGDAQYYQITTQQLQEALGAKEKIVILVDPKIPKNRREPLNACAEEYKNVTILAPDSIEELREICQSWTSQ